MSFESLTNTTPMTKEQVEEMCNKAKKQFEDNKKKIFNLQARSPKLRNQIATYETMLRQLERNEECHFIKDGKCIYNEDGTLNNYCTSCELSPLWKGKKNTEKFAVGDAVMFKPDEYLSTYKLGIIIEIMKERMIIKHNDKEWSVSNKYIQRRAILTDLQAEVLRMFQQHKYWKVTSCEFLYCFNQEKNYISYKVYNTTYKSYDFYFDNYDNLLRFITEARPVPEPELKDEVKDIINSSDQKRLEPDEEFEDIDINEWDNVKLFKLIRNQKRIIKMVEGKKIF